jgi:hypothetical protein
MKLRTAVATVALGLSGMGAAHAASLSYTLTADNAFSVYISNTNTGPGAPGTLLFSNLGLAAGQWSTPVTGGPVTLSGSVEYLNIIAYNYTTSNNLYPPSQGTPPSGSNPDALLGSLTITGGGYVFPNGLTSVLTDTTDWLSAQLATPNPDDPTKVVWITPAKTPQSYGTNGVAPWGTIGGISGDAEWIWSDPDNNF